MNIILLGPREPIPPTKGGAIEKLTYGLASSLASKGHNVIALSTCDEGSGIYEVNGVKVICLSRPIPGKIYSKEMLDFSKKARKVTEGILTKLTNNNTIIHSVYLYNLVSFLTFEKVPIVVTEFEHYPWIPEYLYHYPFISTYRRIRWEGDSRIRKMLAKIIVSRTSKIVFISRFQCQQFLKSIKIPESKYAIIPNAVDINFYRPMNVYELKKKIAEEAEAVLLFVGRLTPHKGLHLLLKAIARLTPSYRRRIKLFIIGPRAPGFRFNSRISSSQLKYEAYIDFLLRRYKLSNVVRFTGQVHESKLPLYYNVADILVHPSLVEAFGLVVIEAMACGKPVLAFNIPPLNEIISENETGILAKPTLSSLVEKLAYIIDNIDEIRKLGAKSRRIVEEMYSWEVISDNYLRLYETLLGGESNRVVAGCVVSKICV